MFPEGARGGQVKAAERSREVGKCPCGSAPRGSRPHCREQLLAAGRAEGTLEASEGRPGGEAVGRADDDPVLRCLGREQDDSHLGGGGVGEGEVYVV